jgi:hypothetical protein
MRKVAKLAGPGPSLPVRSSCAVRAFGIPAEVSGPPRPSCGTQIPPPANEPARSRRHRRNYATRRLRDRVRTWPGSPQLTAARGRSARARFQAVASVDRLEKVVLSRAVTQSSNCQGGSGQRRDVYSHGRAAAMPWRRRGGRWAPCRKMRRALAARRAVAVRRRARRGSCRGRPRGRLSPLRHGVTPASLNGLMRVAPWGGSITTDCPVRVLPSRSTVDVASVPVR